MVLDEALMNNDPVLVVLLAIHLRRAIAMGENLAISLGPLFDLRFLDCSCEELLLLRRKVSKFLQRICDTCPLDKDLQWCGMDIT